MGGRHPVKGILFSKVMCTPEDVDISGALAWAEAIPRAPNGRMRAWLDVEADAAAGVPRSMLWL